jgi:hypothetical protein
MTCIAHTQNDPKLFVWPKTAGELLDRDKRCC